MNEKADNVEKPADAADIIKEYGQILRTKRKGIVSVANYEGKVFSRFWEKKVYEAGKKVWSAQEYYTIQNKHF